MLLLRHRQTARKMWLVRREVPTTELLERQTPEQWVALRAAAGPLLTLDSSTATLMVMVDTPIVAAAAIQATFPAEEALLGQEH